MRLRWLSWASPHSAPPLRRRANAPTARAKTARAKIATTALVRATRVTNRKPTVTPDARAELSDLMQRLADGDRTVLGEVYRRLWPAVRAFCGATLSPADAEDVAQAALLRLVGQAHRFDRRGDALRWALTIAGWEVRTQRRRLRRSRVEPMHQELRARDDPEAEMHLRQIEERLEATIGRLSPLDRETIEAALTGKSADATFRQRKHRALARLKRLWSAHESS